MEGVWDASLLTACWPNVECYDVFAGERTERPENVVVSKNVNTHASSEMANYVEKKQQRIAYEQST